MRVFRSGICQRKNYKNWFTPETKLSVFNFNCITSIKINKFRLSNPMLSSNQGYEFFVACNPGLLGYKPEIQGYPQRMGLYRRL